MEGLYIYFLNVIKSYQVSTVDKGDNFTLIIPEQSI